MEQQVFYVVYFESSQDLVVIIYNLDRVDMRPMTASGLEPPEYLLIDRGEQLQKLNCHIVYTIALDSISPIFTTYKLRNSI
ncbi:hypothetical protein [Argonema galeatum]|uniref:hypothetical protein n=1 Tax=Argonema galeatum TaxID=2942762 RepID=UPI00308426D8